MKILVVILMVITFLLYSPGVSTNAGNIEGYKVESESEYAQNYTETEFELYLGDWKSYEDQVYIPQIQKNFNTFKEVLNNSNKFLIENYVARKNPDPDFIIILTKLNPYLQNEIYRSGVTVTYGITQINVKLIPLAKIYYPDFENNIESQLDFLNFYVKTKKSLGYDMVETVNQYKYCIY